MAYFQTKIEKQLVAINFLQFFVWGAWLPTMAKYCKGTMHWSFPEFGAVFSTLAISSIITPSITGMIADRWINAEKLYGTLQILCGITFCFVPMIKDPNSMFWLILLAMIFYMPTISLANSISYRTLSEKQLSIQKVFPPIRVFGTIGFIAAMWLVNLSNLDSSYFQFIISAIGSILLGIFSFTLPACAPEPRDSEKKSFMETSGLIAFKLFANYRMAMFFVFSMFLGAALQWSNMYAEYFLSTFPEKHSFVVEKSGTIVSISQISETLFILAIPFFLKRFGIKKVMLISMLAWVLRYGFFIYGGTDATGTSMIILSCIVYGMAFDFFNISGSMFIEENVSAKIRSSAQGLFMMMTNGFGAYFGAILSAKMIDSYFMKTPNLQDWVGTWSAFAIYCFILALLFALFFRYKHDKKDSIEITH